MHASIWRHIDSDNTVMFSDDEEVGYRCSLLKSECAGTYRQTFVVKDKLTKVVLWSPLLVSGAFPVVMLVGKSTVPWSLLAGGNRVP